MQQLLCHKCNNFYEPMKGCEVCANTTENWEIAYEGETGLMEKQINKEVREVSFNKAIRARDSAQNEQWRNICQNRGGSGKTG